MAVYVYHVVCVIECAERRSPLFAFCYSLKNAKSVGKQPRKNSRRQKKQVCGAFFAILSRVDRFRRKYATSLFVRKDGGSIRGSMRTVLT